MNKVIRDLSDGLLLKQATTDDVERLAEYNSRYLSDDGPEQPEEVLAHLTRDMMTRHPTMHAGDFTYVEDGRTGQIVSSVCLISQTWSYEEIPFGVGRVELVSTHPEYRRKGLIRAQFDIMHQWSQERGEKMQAVTGIPYFYRQFGYEMTLALEGGRRGYRPHVPKLKDEETERFRFRPATAEDVSFLLEVYDLGRQRSLLSCLRNEETFRYELQVQHETFRSELVIVEGLDRDPVGFIWHSNRLRGSSIGLYLYELKSGISWAAVTPAVIRYLKEKGEAYAAQDKTKQWDTCNFQLGPEHPALDVAQKYLPESIAPYAWYIRVPDLPDFIEHISPVLNRRLAESAHAAYQGELLLDFYRTGVKLMFEQGTLSGVESWQPSTEERGDLAFPPLSFLHLLCGHRSFEELEAFYPDCYRRNKPEAPALINVLFPKWDSAVFAIE
jgi:GNAT superfamily N-acetyltransferase